MVVRASGTPALAIVWLGDSATMGSRLPSLRGPRREVRVGHQVRRTSMQQIQFMPHSHAILAVVMATL